MTNDNPGSNREAREYPFKGLCISGFAMLFFYIHPHSCDDRSDSHKLA